MTVRYEKRGEEESLYVLTIGVLKPYRRYKIGTLKLMIKIILKEKEKKIKV
jgi:hypothetical protein